MLIVWLGAVVYWEALMRKFVYAIATVALFVEPAVALPVVPVPIVPVVSDGQIVSVYYGHWRRVTRRTARRVYRRHHYH
jgi:hypothetical protein